MPTFNGSDHKAGHLDRITDHTATCPTCAEVYADRQRDIQAAARVVRDSERLQAMTPGSRSTTPLGRFADSTFERAEIALAYVQNVHAQYATAEDFDNRFEGVYSEFQDYASQLADDCILDQSGLKSDDPLLRYFDYDSFARDLLLGGDYTAIELDRSYQVAVFNNHG